MIARDALAEGEGEDRVAGGVDVGDVDQPRVDLAQLHLGEHRADVVLVGVRGVRQARGVEHLRRGRAARHLGRAHGEGDVVVEQLRQGREACPALGQDDAVRVVHGDDEHQGVRGEDLGVVGRPASVTLAICASSAEAKTSAGAPWVELRRPAPSCPRS